MSQEISIHHIDKIDRGLAYAEACFETFRIINGHVFQWHQHWQRLTNGLLTFGLKVDSSWSAQVLNACLEQAEKTSPDCLARVTLSGGDAAWGLTNKAHPKVSIQMMSFTSSHSPIDALTVEYPFPVRSKLAKFTSDYGEILRAIHHWQPSCPESKPEQYILCKDGLILSGLTSNIIICVQGKWITPKGDGILDGVVRNFLLERGLVEEHICPTGLLKTCDASYLLNSGQFLRPLKRINARLLDSPHASSSKIFTALSSEKGVLLEHH